jgi:hydrogenase small subunit
MGRTVASFLDELSRRGVSRRQFLGFCSAMAGALALPRGAAAGIARALARRQKPTVVWLEFQDCAGCTESFLRAGQPSVANVVLDLLSVDYHETIMAAAGHQAEANRDRVVKELKGQYIAVVEGAIPSGARGAYCTIGGRAALDIAREVCGNAAAVIAVGTCAAFGGLPAAAPNPTGALSVEQAVPGLSHLINLSACPVNAENITALLVYFLTYGAWPALDHLHRPLFAYGQLIHDNCERRAHFDAGQYAEAWGDEGHRAGYCLYKLGCKGPVTYHNCPNVGWNGSASWPVACGHPCIGCAEPRFWDTMTPFYAHLGSVPGFWAARLDTVGALAAGGVAAAMAGHGLVQIGRRKLAERRAAAGPPPAPAPAGKEGEP